MKNKEMEKAFIENVNDTDVLKLVFEESKHLREEFAENLIRNNDKIWNLKNILMIIAGFYITFFTFVYSKESTLPSFDLISTYPVILCIIFWIVALYFSFCGMVPKYQLFALDPSEVKAIINYNEKNALTDFILTYLGHYKETLIELNKTTILRKKIILFEVYSIFEFAFSVLIYFIGQDYLVFINPLSLIIACFFILIYFYLDYKEKEALNSSIKMLSKFNYKI